jgi:hypothetical protein
MTSYPCMTKVSSRASRASSPGTPFSGLFSLFIFTGGLPKKKKKGYKRPNEYFSQHLLFKSTAPVTVRCTPWGQLWQTILFPLSCRNLQVYSLLSKHDKKIRSYLKVTQDVRVMTRRSLVGEAPSVTDGQMLI